MSSTYVGDVLLSQFVELITFIHCVHFILYCVRRNTTLGRYLDTRGDILNIYRMTYGLKYIYTYIIAEFGPQGSSLAVIHIIIYNLYIIYTYIIHTEILYLYKGKHGRKLCNFSKNTFSTN